ncbi:MAG TPA: hypothetical protein VIV14_01305, partial [Gammaproteobacteria bacterium]
LGRRRVFQVVAVYAVVAWLLVQIVDVVNEPLNLPPWFDTVVIVLLAIGLPIAIVLSWAFDITPQGVVRTESNAEADTEADNDPAAKDAAELPGDSLAVLPFENVSPDPDDAYFAIGIHDEILNQLAKIKGLRLIARTSVLRYKDGKLAIPEIARALRVKTVMEGTVRYSGNRVRITAQLIDGFEDIHLWSETFDRDLDDIFEIQTDIARRIADALTVELSLAEQQSIEARPTKSTEAYQAYLRAIAIFREGDSAIGVTAAPGKRARIQVLLDQAIVSDPEFALAHAWKAWVYTFSRAYDPVDSSRWLSRSAELDELARAGAQRALELDPGLALAHATLAKVRLHNFDLGRAAPEFEAALANGSNEPEVLRWYANYCWFSGEHERAIRFAARAVDADPENAFYYDVLGRVNHSDRNFEEAVKAYRTSVDISPGAAVGYLSLGRSEFALGNETAALHALETAEQLMPADASPSVLADLAMGYRRLSETANAERIFARIEAQNASRFVDPAVWALAHASMRNEEKARSAMKEIIENPALVSNLFTLMFLKENAWSDPMLESPDFLELRGQLSLQS